MNDIHFPKQEDSRPNLTNKLHHDDLLVLFSWLPVEDFASLKSVCHSWRTAATDEYLWKNRVLTVYCSTEYERKVKLMPKIKNIEGISYIILLHVILEYVNKLQKLNVTFKPAISCSQVALIMKKYPELESITLCSCKSDILQSLDMLKTSAHLQEVIFAKSCDHVSPCSSPSLFMEIFIHPKNFPALKSLNLSDNTHFRSEFCNVTFRSIVTSIIENRCQQLLSLKLYLDHPECLGILNAVNSCKKLQVLHLCVNFKNARINIESMNELRSLHLVVFKEDKKFTNPLQISLERGSWLHLTEIGIYIYTSVGRNVGVLKAIIDKCKQLRYLRYMDFGDNTYEDQIEHIGTLANLKSIHLTGLQNISEQGITYLSQCINLKEIVMFPCKSDVSEQHPCIKEMLLQLDYLCSIHIMVVHGKRNICLLLSGKEKIKRHISLIVSHS